MLPASIMAILYTSRTIRTLYIPWIYMPSKDMLLERCIGHPLQYRDADVMTRQVPCSSCLLNTAATGNRLIHIMKLYLYLNLLEEWLHPTDLRRKRLSVVSSFSSTETRMSCSFDTEYARRKNGIPCESKKWRPQALYLMLLDSEEIKLSTSCLSEEWKTVLNGRNSRPLKLYISCYTRHPGKPKLLTSCFPRRV